MNRQRAIILLAIVEAIIYIPPDCAHGAWQDEYHGRNHLTRDHCRHHDDPYILYHP